MVTEYTVHGDRSMPADPASGRASRSGAQSSTRIWTCPRMESACGISGPKHATTADGFAHVVFLLNFFDELRRRIPAGGK
jgi:hypothetical protein